MPHTEAKVVDLSGNIVPKGETGELLIRGVCVFKVNRFRYFLTKIIIVGILQ